MKKLLLILLLMAWCGVANASSTYYVDNTCANNGDGLASGCAAGAGAAGAFNSFTSATSLATGSDVYIKRGTTNLSRLNVNWDGTASDLVEIGPYGTGADPIITGALTEAGPWTQYAATAIYSAPNADYANVHVVTVDGTRIKEVKWDTNIATTAALMSAGTFAFDDAGDKIYVWTSDSADPTTKTVDYGKLGASGYCISGITTGSPDHSHDYLWIHDIDFKMCNASSIKIANGVTASNGTIIENVSFNLCGSDCASIGGNDFILRNSTCTDSNSEGQDIQPCILIEGGGATNTHSNMRIYNNTVTNTRNGSAFEMNHGVVDSFLFNNTATNWNTNFVEVWGGSHRNKIYNNKGENTYSFCTTYAATRYPEGKCRGKYNGGISINSDSDNNQIYNNIILGSGTDDATGSCSLLDVGSTSTNTGNLFFNNTVVNTDATVLNGISVAVAADTGNVFKNNIIKLTGGGASVVGIYFKTASDNTSDYNDIYVGTSTFGKVDTTAKTLATWRTATSQDANTIITDPLIATDYTLQIGSPAIATGVNLSTYFGYDYEGKSKGVLWDIGAIEFQDGSGIDFNGVNFR